MTHSTFMAGARRTVVSTMAALVLTAALPQTGFAQTVRITGDVAIWKLNLEKSKFGASRNTIVLERNKLGGKPVDAADVADSPLLVISNRKVYLGTVSEAGDWNGMKLVQIGDGARRRDYCQASCQFGSRDSSMTLSFRGIDAAGQPISNAVAYNGR